MNLLNTQNRIRDLMSLFVTQVKGATAMRHTDINHVSETVLIPLLAEVYDCPNLHNLNFSESLNFPGIDLGDDTTRVAFQITSTSDSQKIKDTLQKFVEYKLYERFDRLIVYILSEKQKTYSGSGYDEIIQDKFIFNRDHDIQDYRDVLAKITHFQIVKAQKIQMILEANFGSGSQSWATQIQSTQTERIYLNLLEVSFPSTVYVADLDIDRDEIIKSSKWYRHKVKHYSPTRKIVQAALEQQDLRFGVDWVCYENKLVTFHDLDDRAIPLSRVIDAGTITPFGSDEFYEVDENYERVFKSLLRQCLQQKLYHQGVNWQHQEKIFIFSGIDDEERRIEKWYGKRESERSVFEKVMKDNKPDEILYCKHLAFQTQFKRFGDVWYLLIQPDWFFSYDGYKRNEYKSDDIDWLKRKERNSHVYNHLRFIVSFLKPDTQSSFFGKKQDYAFLSFGELVNFDSAPLLDDKKWNPSDKTEIDNQDGDSLQMDFWSEL